MSEMMTLDELFSQEEEKRLMKERAEIAKEMADWNALPQEEKDHIMNERELMWEALEKACEEDEDEDEDEDEEEED